MSVREGRVLISVATDPDFGASYSVTAYEVGAQVTSGSAGTSVTVRAGHGFAANDKFIVVSEFPFVTKYRTVTVAAATTLTINSAVTLSAGDLLVNLAQDTGPTEPNYDGNGLTVYTDMDFSNQAVRNTVTTDSTGRYYYYYQGIAIWDLVHSTTAGPIALYQSAAVQSLIGPSSLTSTDNAVARWDGTNGQVLQNSVVTIGDTGATTGITTLGASGAVTFGSSLAITGALTGVTTLNASGLAAFAAAVTVGTTLGVTGATTLSSTLSVTGATTLTGGVTGNVVATGNVTSGGHLIGKKTALSVSTSTTIATSGTLSIEITNTGTNSCTLVAPSGGDCQLLILRIASLGTSFTLTESTTAQLVGTSWVPDGAGDALTLMSSGTLWSEIARSNN